MQVSIITRRPKMKKGMTVRVRTSGKRMMGKVVSLNGELHLRIGSMEFRTVGLQKKKKGRGFVFKGTLRPATTAMKND